MAKFCLTRQTKDNFKKALKDREIDPVKLAGLSSLERRSFIEKYVGKENAQNINALFESKLLLKNQKAGYITWAKKVTGITPEVKQDIISRIERLDKVLNPKEEEQFLQDLASARLGVEITQEEAKKISELSNKVSELRDKTDKTKSDIKLGRAMLDVTDYVNSLSGKKADLLTNIAGVPRSVMASLDLSAPLNQGWGMISRKRFYTSLGTMFKSAVSKNAFRDLQAEIITHPVYNEAKKAGLRLTNLGDKLEMREEQFMTTLFDKVPGISASQRAYTAFLNKIRIDSFNDLIKKAEVAGEDVTLGSKTNEDLANAVNDFTGGARVGKVEGAVPLLNAAFFSPRKITSTVNMLNPINYVNPKISKTARLERTRNIIGSLALTIGIIALYSLLTGKEQEADPTSSDFGKIRSGNTRLDVSGSNATYINIISRLITSRIKSSTGESKELGTKVGETSGAKLIGQFLRYKLSPNASLLIDAITGENAIGQKKTISESVIDRFKPMFANSLVELLKSDTDGKFGFALGGLIGGGLNTYPDPNIKSKVIPEGKKTSNKDLIEYIKTYAEALGTDPETAFNRIFTGQKIMQVSDGGIIVVNRQSITDSQQFKKDWIKKHGGKIEDIKEVKLDHVVPNKMGGEELKDNWAIVSSSIWSNNTKIETTLIRAVKNGKIKLKDAQDLIKKYKRVGKDSQGNIMENPDKKIGLDILNKFK